MLTCDAHECGREATVVLRFRGMPGHVHVCPPHEAIDREWCDIVASHPMPCPWKCAESETPTAIGTALPTQL